MCHSGKKEAKVPKDPNASPPTSRAALLILMAIIALGTALRLASITYESAWGDEALTTACYPATSFADCMDCVFAEDSRLRLAPVYYWVQYAWSLIAGGSLTALRLLSVALSISATLQIFALARLIAGSTAGLWAAALFSLSLFQVYYGQEVRFYALMNVFALTALHGLILYLRQPRLVFLALCAAGNALLIWTHTFSVVFVFAQGFLLLGWWKQPRTILPWFAAHIIMALALFGWLGLLEYDFAGQSAAYRDMPAGPRELANTFLQFAGGRFSNINPAPWMTLGFSVDLLIAASMAVLAGYALFKAFSKGGEGARPGASRSDAALLVIIFIGPVVGLYLLNWYWRPCFFSRYVVYAALPLHILAGIGLSTIPRGVMQRTASIFVLLLFAWQHLALPRPFRADYIEVARAVATDQAFTRSVIALKPFNFDAVEYALRDQRVPVDLLYGFKEMVGVATTRATAGESVWAVFYRWDDTSAFEVALEKAGATVTRHPTAGMPPLDVFHVVMPVADADITQP
jgi:4-amino-4-deoxy-L-arabinose transferase-like glycosyltransferase